MAIIPGLQVGHATDPEAKTGCTVLLGPFRGAAHVAGHATGSREMDPLSTLHVVPLIDAVLLTGGSAFGLGAADGVMAWLEARGRGFDTGVARVPIVPAAVIFDLAVGRSDRRPDAAMGLAACDAATAGMPVEGAVGAGTGATVGKVLGRENADPGGFGCSVERQSGHSVLGLAVVNPVGDVLDSSGRIIAGARAADGSLADSTKAIRASDAPRFGAPPAGPTAGTNTTLAAVVTDAPIPRASLAVVVRMASAALARRISPAFTPFDGDIIFALSTSAESVPMTPGEVMVWGAVATRALENAIERAVRSG